MEKHLIHPEQNIQLLSRAEHDFTAKLCICFSVFTHITNRKQFVPILQFDSNIEKKNQYVVAWLIVVYFF